jgi:hypothetical protein
MGKVGDHTLTVYFVRMPISTLLMLTTMMQHADTTRWDVFPIRLLNAEVLKNEM